MCSPKWIILTGLALCLVATVLLALGGGKPNDYWPYVFPAFVLGSAGNMLTYSHAKSVLIIVSEHYLNYFTALLYCGLCPHPWPAQLVPSSTAHFNADPQLASSLSPQYRQPWRPPMGVPMSTPDELRCFGLSLQLLLLNSFPYLSFTTTVQLTNSNQRIAGPCILHKRPSTKSLMMLTLLCLE